MTLDKTHLIVFLVGAFLGFLSGFFSGKAVYDRPMTEKVTRDTITLHDTIPDINPVPRDSARIKYITRWLPASNHVADASKMISRNECSENKNSVSSASFSVKDSVAVEVPITSKHYKSEQYDAYISGFEPNLDSIFVYQKTEYITETIERTVKPKRKPWGIGFHAGYGYDFKSKTAAPFIGVGISYDIISF